MWGWSGTLADDVQRQVAAVNAALAALGAPPVDLDTIRHHFAPSPPALCAAILGRPLTDRARTRASVAFETYHSRRPPPDLLPGAEGLLTRLLRSGCSHSVLSLGAHNRLTQHISELGVDSFFLRIDGRTGPSARSKTQPLAEHLPRCAPRLETGRSFSSGMPWTTSGPRSRIRFSLFRTPGA